MCRAKESGYIRRCPSCKKRFYICTRCDRGHRYCSRTCRVEGRRSTFRRASRLYQSSPAGRTNHAERQKTYRKNRQLRKTMTQQSSGGGGYSLKSKDSGFAQIPIFNPESRSPSQDFRPSCLVCRVEIDWYRGST